MPRGASRDQRASKDGYRWSSLHEQLACMQTVRAVWESLTQEQRVEVMSVSLEELQQRARRMDEEHERSVDGPTSGCTGGCCLGIDQRDITCGLHQYSLNTAVQLLREVGVTRFWCFRYVSHPHGLLLPRGSRPGGGRGDEGSGKGPAQAAAEAGNRQPMAHGPCPGTGGGESGDGTQHAQGGEQQRVVHRQNSVGWRQQGVDQRRDHVLHVQEHMGQRQESVEQRQEGVEQRRESVNRMQEGVVPQLQSTQCCTNAGETSWYADHHDAAHAAFKHVEDMRQYIWDKYIPQDLVHLQHLNRAKGGVSSGSRAGDALIERLDAVQDILHKTDFAIGDLQYPGNAKCQAAQARRSRLRTASSGRVPQLVAALLDVFDTLNPQEWLYELLVGAVVTHIRVCQGYREGEEDSALKDLGGCKVALHELESIVMWLLWVTSQLSPAMRVLEVSAENEQPKIQSLWETMCACPHEALAIVEGPGGPSVAVNHNTIDLILRDCQLQQGLAASNSGQGDVWTTPGQDACPGAPQTSTLQRDCRENCTSNTRGRSGPSSSASSQAPAPGPESQADVLLGWLYQRHKTWRHQLMHAVAHPVGTSAFSVDRVLTLLISALRQYQATDRLVKSAKSKMALFLREGAPPGTKVLLQAYHSWERASTLSSEPRDPGEEALPTASILAMLNRQLTLYLVRSDLLQLESDRVAREAQALKTYTQTVVMPRADLELVELEQQTASLNPGHKGKRADSRNKMSELRADTRRQVEQYMMVDSKSQTMAKQLEELYELVKKLRAAVPHLQRLKKFVASIERGGLNQSAEGPAGHPEDAGGQIGASGAGQATGDAERGESSQGGKGGASSNQANAEEEECKGGQDQRAKASRRQEGGLGTHVGDDGAQGVDSGSHKRSSGEDQGCAVDPGTVNDQQENRGNEGGSGEGECPTQGSGRMRTDVTAGVGEETFGQRMGSELILSITLFSARYLARSRDLMGATPLSEAATAIPVGFDDASAAKRQEDDGEVKLSQFEREVKELRRMFLHDIRPNLWHEDGETALFSKFKQEIKAAEERLEECLVALDRLELALMAACMWDPGSMVVDNLLLPAIQERLESKVQEVATQRAWKAEQEILSKAARDQAAQDQAARDKAARDRAERAPAARLGPREREEVLGAASGSRARCEEGPVEKAGKEFYSQATGTASTNVALRSSGDVWTDLNVTTVSSSGTPGRDRTDCQAPGASAAPRRPSQERPTCKLPGPATLKAHPTTRVPCEPLRQAQGSDAGGTGQQPDTCSPAVQQAAGLSPAQVESVDHSCVVCMERGRTEVLVPCGHVVLCTVCCEAVCAASNECPMCREGIIAVVHIQC